MKIAKQKGVVMMIALIALAAMSLAAISLMRTVDTTNVISGNLSFNEATIQLADTGADLAYGWITGNLFSNTGGCQYIGGSKCPTHFAPNASSLDAKTKLPCALYNNLVPPNDVNSSGNCIVGTPALTWSDGSDQVGTAPSNPFSPTPGYNVRFAIERMCGIAVGGGAQTADPPNSASPVNTATTQGSLSNAPTFANCMAQPLYADAPGAMLTGGAVTRVSMTSGGSGYTSFPAVTFLGGGSPTATATGVTVGSVSSVNVTSPGSGCANGSIVTFSGGAIAGQPAPAQATGTYSNGTVTIVTAGSGYTALPAVTFPAGCSAVAAVNGVTVSGINITSGGAGYTSNPVVSIAAPPVGGAQAYAGILPTQGRLYFRVTVQVTGPKNTQAMMQYFPGFNDNVY